MSDLPLAGCKAVVLGADREPGASIAYMLAERGADVAAASTTGDSAEAFEMRGLVRRIEGLGRQAMLEAIDQGNGSNVQVGMRQIAKQLGSVDLVVVAPGIGLYKASERITDAEWSRVIGYNLDALFYACRAAAREMTGNEASPKGRIIALLTEAAEREGASAMQGARAGAEALLRSLAAEWAGQDILVNGIAVPDALTETHTSTASAETLRLATSYASGEVVALG